jgi:hypothetical protein
MDLANPQHFSDEERAEMCKLLSMQGEYLKVIFNDKDALILDPFMNELEAVTVQAISKPRAIEFLLDEKTLAPITTLPPSQPSLVNLDTLYPGAVCVVKVATKLKVDDDWKRGVYWTLLHAMVSYAPLSKLGRSRTVIVKVIPPMKGAEIGASTHYPFSDAKLLLPRLVNKPWVNYSKSAFHCDETTNIIAESLNNQYVAYVVFNMVGKSFVVSTFCLLRGDSMVYGGKYLIDSMKLFARTKKANKIEIDVSETNKNVLERMGFKEEKGMHVLHLRKKRATRSKCCTIA